MVSQKITLALDSGLHARPVSQIIGFLDGRDGSFTMAYGGIQADCKSALSLLMLGVAANAEVEVSVESNNEQADLKDFVDFLLSLDH
ncbi:MAG: HPr family phosphocarrier protein [Defluviitaleaceae bacterium]|nr:HPr family phosphocarrier protein [Defluviitaleaceae bacterium]